jgi:hypothetical protein
MFNLETCAEAAQTGKLQEWVLDYLDSGYWVNLGLRDGLLLQKRYWIGLYLDRAFKAGTVLRT